MTSVHYEESEGEGGGREEEGEGWESRTKRKDSIMMDDALMVASDADQRSARDPRLTKEQAVFHQKREPESHPMCVYVCTGV